MTKIKINIDGRDIEAEGGSFLLETLRKEGFFIPTLCNHEEITPYGVCRLCIVEWVRDGWSKVVTSCNFPIKDGQKFLTNTDRIRKERQTIMELILSRSSNVPEVVELAQRLGVETTRFPKDEEGCILCGLCIKACEEVVGVSAIGFQGRGPSRKVIAPFDDSAKACIGCGSCAFVCPTNYIKMEEKDHVRKIPLWHVEYKMQQCKTCGADIAPKKQLEYIKQKVGLPSDFFDNCLNCRA
jgi:NADH dehydrogenase/NADH:ubiquinone oxidoreductase subunit G